jgi:hypothetical protein
MYRFLRLIDPLVQSWVAHGAIGLDGVVVLRVSGRRSGRARSMAVTLLGVDGAWYVGHPNGEVPWTHNAEAAGLVEIDPPAASGSTFRVVRLGLGAERDAVIQATRSQQPFPGNLVYRAAARHIAAVGVYFRLEPVAAETAEAGADPHGEIRA